MSEARASLDINMCVSYRRRLMIGLTLISTFNFKLHPRAYDENVMHFFHY